MRPIRFCAAVAAAACLSSTAALAADFPFVDSSVQARNQACIQVEGSQFTVTGQVTQQNATTFTNQIVTIGYGATGTGTSTGSGGSKGTFTSVDVSLSIIAIDNTAPPVPTEVLYPLTIITAPCKLKAAVKDGGARGTTRLSCKLGDGLSAFPNLTPELLDSIDQAFRARKSMKISVKNGKFRVQLNGVASPPDQVPLPPCPDPNAPPEPAANGA